MQPGFSASVMYIRFRNGAPPAKALAAVETLVKRDAPQFPFDFGLAFPIAWFIMHNWLQNFIYRISISAWVFVMAAMLSLAVALITIVFQTLRAAMANPVTSLRSE